MPNRRAKYRQDLADGKPWDAALNLSTCARVLQDAELSKLVADAEVRAYVEDLYDRKRSPGERSLALERLRQHYPEVHSQHAAVAKQIEQAGRRQEEVDKRRLAAERRKQGVRIGMTKEEVLQSSWGRPRSVNKTTFAWGTREQWVYDGGYLYFDDDKLTAIQN